MVDQLVNCPSNYAVDNRTASCIECERPYTAEGGHTSTSCLSLCVEGYYMDADGKCQECKEKGMLCDKVGVTVANMRIKHGWYRFSENAERAYRCPYESHCIGNSSDENSDRGYLTGEGSCAANSKGPLCSLCLDRYFLTSEGTCEECSSAEVAKSIAWIIVVAVLFLALIMAWIFREHLSSPWLRDRGERIKTWMSDQKVGFDWARVSLRILFYDVQVIDKYTRINDVDWPSPFKSLASVYSGASLDMTTLVPSLECSRTWDAYTALLLWTLMPIGAYVLAIAYKAARAWQQEGACKIKGS